MKYFILGGAGFLGKSLINSLLSDNYAEIVYYDLAPISASKVAPNERLSYINGNFAEENNFDQLLKGVNIVIHMISTTRPQNSINGIEEDITQNVLPTIGLIEACASRKIKIIFISSGGTVYGAAYNKEIGENDLTDPICSYGIQKLMIEKYLYLFYYVKGLDYRVIRLANPYGYFQAPNSGVGVIPTFLYNIIHDIPVVIRGDGSAIRDYIYIDDAIRMIRNIINYTGEEKVFNVGSGEGFSICQVIKLIECVAGKTCNIQYVNARDTDVSYNVLNIEKYKSIFKDMARIDLEMGINLLYVSMREEVS